MNIPKPIYAALESGARAIAQYLILVAIFRTSGAAQVGEYAYGLALSAPFFMCAFMRLGQLCSTDTDATHSFQSYLGLRIFAGVLAIAGTIAAWFLLGKVVAVQLLAATALFRLALGIAEIIYSRIHRDGNFYFSCLSTLGFWLVSIPIFSTGLYKGLPLSTMLVTISAIRILQALLIDLSFQYRIARVLRLPSLGVVYQDVRDLLASAWAFAPLAFVNSSTTSVPRLLIEFFAGKEALGLFTMAVSIVDAYQQLVESAIRPTVIKMRRRAEQQGLNNIKSALIKEVSLLTIGAWLLFLTGTLVAGKFVLGLFYGQSADAVYQIFLILVAGSLLYFIKKQILTLFTTWRDVVAFRNTVVLDLLISVVIATVLLKFGGLQYFVWGLCFTWLTVSAIASFLFLNRTCQQNRI